MNAPALKRPARNRQSVFLDEVIANHFRSIVEEMSTIVLRSAHTTFIKETQDYATTLTSVEGEMFAYPHNTGVTSLLGMPVAPGIAAMEKWAPGDVMLTNDPYTTAGMVMHLPDLTLLKPIFAQGKLLCFAWTFMHCSDVGGALPGSINMANTEVFQEGIRIRPVKLYDAGVLNQTVWNLIADNCRIPDLNWGDVGALLAGLNTSEKRMLALVEKYGLDAVRGAIYATLDQTEKKTRAILSKIPPGRYSFVDYLEDDVLSDAPIRLCLTLTAKAEGTVELDFRGSDPQVQASLNMPTGNQRHHPFLCMSLMSYIVTQSEGMHLNSGILRCIDLVLPKNSVVNANFPAACGMRYITGMRLSDCILGAMAQALPDSVPSPGAGGASITVVSITDTSTGKIKLAVANPVYGGSGAGPTLDGFTGLDYPLAFFRNVPAEVLEAEMPVRVHGFGALPDSEGAGLYRGGFGVWYDIEVLYPGASVIMRGKERYVFQPWGVHGGNAAASGYCRLTRPDGAEVNLGKAGQVGLRMSERLFIAGPGGGGYGDPLARPVVAVLRDVLDDLVSTDRAATVYGVVVSDGKVDSAKTDETRRRLRQQRVAPKAGDIDRGKQFTAWREQNGEGADAIWAWLAEVPESLRPYARDAAFEKLRATAAPVSRSQVEQLCQELGKTLARAAIH